jgi:hypothetical protein
MSTLSVATVQSVTTIQSSASNTPPVINDSSGTQVGQFARAWVNFNGTGTVAIRAAFNVSSITDNGTGDYTINFTNALPDANYTVVASSSPAYTVTRNNSICMASANTAAAVITPTTLAFRLATCQGNAAAGTAYDATFVFASFFR